MTLDELENNIELGRQVFEAVPKTARPGWGTTLLQAFENYLDNIPIQVKGLYEITEDKKNWRQAHEQFTKIRTFSLANPDFQPESYIMLAEKVAKTTYNESGLPAPFDKHSGWWIAINAKRTADYFNDRELKKEIFRILTFNMD